MIIAVICHTFSEGSVIESVLAPSVKTTKIRGTPSSLGRAPFFSLNP